MKIVSIICGLMLCSLSLMCFAQKKQEEKKKAEIYKEYRDRSASQADVSDLLEEADDLKQDNPKGALDKVEEALGVSIAQRDALNEGRSYLLLGEINESIQEWKLALDNYNSAYEKLEPGPKGGGDYAGYRKAILGLANTNRILGNLDKALQLYGDGLSISSNSTEQKKFRLGISEVFYQQGNFQEALNILGESSKGAGKNSTGDSRKLKAKDDDADEVDLSIQNQKAKIYARLNDLDRAKSALQSTTNTLRSSPSSIPQQEQGLKDAKEEVAGALHEQQRYDEEIDLRNESIELNMQANNFSAITEDKVGISKALEAKGETSEAIRELEEAALFADTINDPKEQAKAFLALADLYEKNGRTSQVISTYKRYSTAINKAEEQNKARMTEKTELIEKQKDIESLTKDLKIGVAEYAVEEATLFRQELTIYGLLLIILIIVITSYFIYKNAQASKVANQLLALKSLRSQMNPHFIFNALNSVNHFVAQNDERTVNKFLSEFSRLMRLVMENSQEDFIPLYKEHEIISLYLKLEHYRFRDKFDYEMKIDDDINLETFEIPPMLLQPYIENAVWHGLRYKESKGHLSLNIRKNSHGLEVEITDDGIGRKRSAELKTDNQKKHHSTGIKNIEERLRIINKVYKSHYAVRIKDLEASGGTQVVISIPEHKQNGRS